MITHSITVSYRMNEKTQKIHESIFNTLKNNIPWITNLTSRVKAKNRKGLKGYFSKVSAITTIEKGVNGNNAAIIIKAPPHFRTNWI